MFERLLGLPVVASEHGESVDDFIVYIHWLMAFLFVVWVVYFVYVLWRFRARRGVRASYVGARSHLSSYLEGGVAFVEAVLLIGFAVPLWAKMVDEVPGDGEANVVRVMAEQFGWNFMYPGPDGVFGAQDVKFLGPDNKFGRVLDDGDGLDDFLTLNDLRVPVDFPTVFHVSSLDVIHSFKVIALRVCQDAIPGLSIPTWCVPKREGRYQINCAQLCGIGHAAMTQGFLTVMGREEFDDWVGEMSVERAGDVGGFE